jgi:chondroitin AC lyase
MFMRKTTRRVSGIGGVIIIILLASIVYPAVDISAQTKVETIMRLPRARVPGGDLDIIRGRLLAPLLVNVDIRLSRRLLDTIRNDGSWPDIDYADQNPAVWKTVNHIGNILQLARAYAAPTSSLKGDVRLRKAILQALDYWYSHDYANPNWWYNEIGVPQQLAPVLLIIENDLDRERRERGIAILARAKLGMTGQNLIWTAEINVKRGILANDPALMEEALGRISQALSLSLEEGIQPDYSFHQHGSLLYSHGYGAEFALDCARFASILTGTKYALPPEKIKILNALVLDGHQWFTRGKACDFGTLGRQITRRNQTAGYLIRVVDEMLKIPGGREKELLALRARFRNEEAPPLIGNRHFWRSDIMVHQRPGYYASARMFSTRTLNTDQMIYNEGFLSHHLADGCTVFMIDGYEYLDIAPVWDWLKIPGTTVVQTTLKGEVSVRGERSFAGGVSDGQYGMAAFDLVRGTLRARKSWFFFDDEVVCLGAGITDTGDSTVVTTINQCFLRDDVLIGTASGQRTLPRGKRLLDGVAWIHHDDIGYVFPAPESVTIENDTRTGTWWNVTHSYGDIPYSNDVFACWLDHGDRPSSKSYAYIVLPGKSPQETAVYSRRLMVTIIRNTPSIQAVRHTALALTGAAFYQPGSVTIRKGLELSVDRPCLVLIHEENGTVNVAVSDPAQTNVREIIVTLTSSNNRITLTMPLPHGGDAGKSVVKTVKVG